MSEQTRRLAENESLFRQINETIEDVALDWPTGGDPDLTYDFLCECSNTDCTAPLKLTTAQYEHIRSSGRWFGVLPHHNLPEIEDVVEEHRTYWIVEKRGETGEHVALLDPRRGDG